MTVEPGGHGFSYFGTSVSEQLPTKELLKGQIMKTHNATIYHCLTCGHVVHAELEAKAPQCCGNDMTKACAETIHEGDAIDGQVEVPFEGVPPGIKGREKPR